MVDLQELVYDLYYGIKMQKKSQNKTPSDLKCYK